MKHLRLLDGIRGFAIISVMLYHFSITFQHQSDLIPIDFFVAKILQSGWLGVDLFFVMSGFLITSILYNSTENNNYFKNFYVRRFLRIFPLYYFILIVLIFIIPTISDSLYSKTKLIQDNSFWFWTYLLNWRVAYLGGFEGIQAGYMWSLAVEEQFYLVWPIVVKYFKNYLIKICLILMLLGLILKIIFFNMGFNATVIYVMSITHFDGLLLGSLLSVVYFHKKINFNIFKICSCIAALTLLGVVIKEKNLAFYSDYVSVLGVSASSVLFCSLLLFLLLKGEKSLYNRCFLFRPVMYFGKLCYGLYLVHHPIGIFVNERIIAHDTFLLNGSYIPSLILSIALSTLISVVVAHLSYHLFEKYFLRLKHKFE